MISNYSLSGYSYSPCGFSFLRSGDEINAVNGFPIACKFE
jgi:hypothetical protein